MRPTQGSSFLATLGLRTQSFGIGSPQQNETSVPRWGRSRRFGLANSGERFSLSLRREGRGGNGALEHSSRTVRRFFAFPHTPQIPKPRGDLPSALHLGLVLFPNADRIPPMNIPPFLRATTRTLIASLCFLAWSAAS